MIIPESSHSSAFHWFGENPPRHELRTESENYWSHWVLPRIPKARAFLTPPIMRKYFEGVMQDIRCPLPEHTDEILSNVCAMSEEDLKDEHIPSCYSSLFDAVIDNLGENNVFDKILRGKLGPVKGDGFLEEVEVSNDLPVQQRPQPTERPFGTYRFAFDSKPLGFSAVKRESEQCADDESVKKKQKIEVLQSHDLADDVKLQVTMSEGEKKIDIRKWTSNGPVSKKGIAMSLQRFLRVERLKDQVQSVIDDIKAGKTVNEKFHVGGPLMLQMASPFHTIHLREFYKGANSESILPGSKGIVLKWKQWVKVMELIPLLETTIPELREIRICDEHSDHLNQMGFMMCPECNPFSYKDYLF